MQRTLALSLLVVGAAVALVVGSYSAFAGSGPVAGAVSAVVGADDPDDGDVATGEETDDVDGAAVSAQDADDGEGAQKVAQVIADAFGVSEEDVLALHEQGIGFGALFKLYVLGAATGTSVDGLLATVSTNGDGEREFAFGKLFKEMADEVSALSAGEDGVPRNLGQAVSNSGKSDKAVAAVTGDGGEDDGGNWPPDQAPAHGRR